MKANFNGTCPKCLRRVDGCRHPPDGHCIPPAAGTFMVCLYCQAVVQVHRDGSVGLVTAKMLQRLYKLDPTFKSTIEQVKRICHEMMGEG